MLERHAGRMSLRVPKLRGVNGFQRNDGLSLSLSLSLDLAGPIDSSKAVLGAQSTISLAECQGGGA